MQTLRILYSNLFENISPEVQTTIVFRAVVINKWSLRSLNFEITKRYTTHLHQIQSRYSPKHTLFNYLNFIFRIQRCEERFGK